MGHYIRTHVHKYNIYVYMESLVPKQKKYLPHPKVRQEKVATHSHTIFAKSWYTLLFYSLVCVIPFQNTISTTSVFLQNVIYPLAANQHQPYIFQHIFIFTEKINNIEEPANPDNVTQDQSWLHLMTITKVKSRHDIMAI